METLGDIIERISAGATMAAIATELNINERRLSALLKHFNFIYSPVTGKRDYKGTQDIEVVKQIPVQEVLNTTVPKAEKPKTEIKKVSKKDGGNTVAKKDTATLKNELFTKLGLLPSKKDKKKSSIEISKQTHDEFFDFYDRLGLDRMTKNDLVEMAMRDFLEKYDN